MEFRWIYEFGGEVVTLCLAAWCFARALMPNWMPTNNKSRRAVALEGMLWFVCAVGLYEDWWWATIAISLVVLTTIWPSYVKERPTDCNR